MTAAAAGRRHRRGLKSAAMLVLAVAGSVAARAEGVWTRWEDLPDALGRKGMFGGVSNGHLILAGGSNFPVPQRAGGGKRFHRDLVVRALPLTAGEPWRVVSEGLPRGRGEGAAVTTPDGVWCLGGQEEGGAVAEVLRLWWDRGAGRVGQQRMPDLPEPVAAAAAAELEGWIYVAGGTTAGGARRNFWRLEAARAVASPGTAAWETLPAWEGAGRFGGVLAAVSMPAGARLLFAGGIGGPARSQADYLREAMLFDPRAGRWSPAAALPRGAVLGAAISADRSRVLLLGGSDGHDFPRMRELGERYRLPAGILVYDAAADTWGKAGEMPLGVVGAAVIRLDDRWLVAGGEPSPGLRTPRVYEFRLGRP